MVAVTVGLEIEELEDIGAVVLIPGGGRPYTETVEEGGEEKEKEKEEKRRD